MSIKTKDYLKGFIILLIMVLLIFILDLPKTTLIVIGVTIPFVVIMHELFSSKEKDITRKREYITSILFFIIFAVLIFVFDLPKKLYIFIGVMPISSIILYELFNINKKK